MSDPQPQDDSKLAVIVAVAAGAAVVLFTNAERRLLARFAKLIAKYTAGELLHFQMRKVAQQIAADVTAQARPMVARVIGSAAREGLADGVKAASGVPPKPPSPVIPLGLPDGFLSHAEMSAQAIRDDLDGKINQLGLRITRFADDVYRAVTPDAAIGQVLGDTVQAAQRRAYQDLVAKGITGFTDSRGRNWSLSAYVEMAVRTSAQRAYNVSHLARMQSLGVELFTVTDDGHPCPLCAPWQGKILSVLPDERADATIAEATAAGLYHVRCRHTLVAYFPGVTHIAAPHEWNAADQKRYDESQQQRALERRIRAAKRQLDAAYDAQLKQAANANVRAAQKAMRDFIEKTGRVRNTRREQQNLGLKP